MALTLARPAAGTKHFPSAASIQTMMMTTSTPEAAQYAVEQYKKCFSGSKLSEKPSVKNILNVLETYADNLESIVFSGASWSGKEPLPAYLSLQEKHAEMAREVIGAETTAMKLDFAVSQKSELIRGYSSEGKALEDSKLKAMDDLFNGWLSDSKRNLKCVNGVIYQGDVNEQGKSSGEIAKDAKGNELRVDPDSLKAMIADKDTGFAAYVQQQSPSVNLTLQSHPFPGEESTMEAKEEAAPSGGASGGSGH